MKFKNLMLFTELNDNLIAIIVLALTLILAIIIVVSLKKHYKNEKEMITKRQPKHLSLSLNKQYLTPKEWNFLSALYKALPPEFIAFPKVKLSNIINATNDRIAKEMIVGQQVDVCIFTRDELEPILVVDLVEGEATNLTFKTTAPIVKQSLKTVKLPILEITIKPDYDIVELKKKLINTMPDKVVALLKNKYEIKK